MSATDTVVEVVSIRPKISEARQVSHKLCNGIRMMVISEYITQTHRCDLLPSRWCQSAGYAAKEIKFDYFRYVSNFDPFHRNSVNTIVAAYFIYPNGTALTSDQVELMLSQPDHYLELRGLGLTYIVSTSGPTC